MKKVTILLAVCVSAILVITVLLAGTQTAVSASTASNLEMPPLESVEIFGPVTATIDTTYLFTAVVQPPTATQPITYYWDVLGSSQWTLTETDNTAAIEWHETGQYEVYVGADNGLSFVETSYTVTVVTDIPVAAQIYINRDMTSPTKDGLINTSNQSIVGPLRCTASGDPYSNFSSPFRPPNYPPGPYTYRYRILIPDSYTADTLRVELFDPETANAATNSATIMRTNYAISQGLSPTTSGSCSSTNRFNPCLIGTGEEALVNDNVSVDDVNILWFMRTDENRPPGCGIPTTYNPADNTTTVFELYYYSITGSTPQRVDLATYTGRPDDAHATDLRWVSPGAPPSFDQPVFVPVDAGSPKSFQLNLAQDLPNIEVDVATGGRYLYLDVTAVGGSSENGFDIWAGPAIYAAAIPSDVNARNIAVLNDPGSHSSGGVEIFSVGYLPQNLNTYNRDDIPLIEIGPEYAGETVYISMFDADNGVQPPVTFYFDSMAFHPGPPMEGDWFEQFGIPGTIDPDGVPASSRCDLSSGACNNQWIDPPYQITVPGNLENCDYTNPTQADCTPFFGGRLFVSFEGAGYDTYGWEVKITEPTNPNSGASCAAFPIAIHSGIRSVYPPGTGTGNDYPNPGDFHPSSPQPSYSNFPNNVPDTLLQDAQAGAVYKIYNGTGPGSFDWIRWNIGILGGSTRVADSLTWPGDSQDYMDHGDGGQPATPLYNHVVRGYVNPFDTSDLALNVDDWLALNTGSVNSSPLRDVVNDHIYQGRMLRLPVWSGMPMSQGGNTFVEVQGFATFRIQGHNIPQSGASWILLEFVGWDVSCGQLSGPTNVQLNSATAKASRPLLIGLLGLLFVGLSTAVLLTTHQRP